MLYHLRLIEQERFQALANLLGVSWTRDSAQKQLDSSSKDKDQGQEEVPDKFMVPLARLLNPESVHAHLESIVASMPTKSAGDTPGVFDLAGMSKDQFLSFLRGSRSATQGASNTKAKQAIDGR